MNLSLQLSLIDLKRNRRAISTEMRLVINYLAFQIRALRKDAENECPRARYRRGISCEHHYRVLFGAGA